VYKGFTCYLTWDVFTTTSGVILLLLLQTFTLLDREVCWRNRWGCKEERLCVRCMLCDFVCISCRPLYKSLRPDLVSCCPSSFVREVSVAFAVPPRRLPFAGNLIEET